MQISIAEAEALLRRAFMKLGYAESDLDSPVAHLIDCELRGLEYAGFSRILSISERLKRDGFSTRPITTTRESPVSAHLDGADNIGYIVGQRATDIAIEKALESGISIVGASDTWYTGMLSFFAEQATARDLVVLIFSNAAPWVAPYGGTEGKFGTNPVCFGFPSAEEPVIWDIGTSEIIHAQVVLARRLGRELPVGVAFDEAGKPTVDPVSALSGAFVAWGGHKGSGLAIAVQLFGILAGSAVIPDDLGKFGMVVICVRPDLLGDTETFKQGVAEYAREVRSTRPVEGGSAVRMPFDRSRQDREARRQGGVLEVPEVLVDAVRALADG
ncbi:Ldh family oxidoreductase [Acuticoccus mangrovi]|uniref:Ldh family oxidoreductase n=1 Tax=Acuticoccus mangrovi TaxID=2796142 RepID=A0A934IKD0_9HYPH|nr:Ldh family oxidoreductase [Acuticoccus mangrovi]MBJ3778098.1 Ldh family oxidoreductase [Acuticoccus mangrovi]